MKLSQVAVRLAVTPLGAAFDRWCVRFLGESPVSWVFARSEGVAYNPPILLTTRGRKSGEPRTVVLPHFRAAPGRIAVVGSRGGMPTDPYWARNLRAHPHATIWYARRPIEVEARLVEGDEREPLWESITKRSPVYLQYQKRATGHREIPVFELTAKDGTRLDAPA
ncbi:MAG: nitroreductase family deazaflavin-dependent oxidoreductase [Spirochaetaceae bacterium]|nr:nitroreductase family deazaflavin-dependent oxidoreductase [Myxococcales bacterium]MCB9723019.1 nitroreductase family deazaflavin-dependent oxidoreductase [Spirochaetaceae bacterium]HPG24291.1 nitroreductase family deazaflavin-dependent oxidoreductase [Myxococcota bacterium]